MTQFCVCYCEIQVVPGLSGAFWGWVCCSTLKCVFRGLDFLSSCADSDALSGAPLSQSYGVISETNILRSSENLAIPLSPARLEDGADFAFEFLLECHESISCSGQAH